MSPTEQGRVERVVLQSGHEHVDGAQLAQSLGNLRASEAAVREKSISDNEPNNRQNVTNKTLQKALQQG